MNYTSRAQWGARAPKTAPAPMTSVLGIAFHYEGVDVPVDLLDYKPRVRGIQAYHLDTQKWNDIAYNFLVDPRGGIYEGRGWGVRSGANGTTYANGHYLAFCYLGGPNTPFTDAAKTSMAALIRESLARYPLATDLQPHSRFFNTACPGDAIRKWIASGTPTAVVPPPQPEKKVHKPMGIAYDKHDKPYWISGAVDPPSGKFIAQRLSAVELMQLAKVKEVQVLLPKTAEGHAKEAFFKFSVVR